MMRRASWHTFQILTKRPERLLQFAGEVAWPGNVWAGVRVEARAYLFRLEYVRAVPAAVRLYHSSPCRNRSAESSYRGLTGSSLVANPAREPARWTDRGSCRSETSALTTGYRSSSSSGVVRGRKLPDASWMDAPGTRCPSRTAAAPMDWAGRDVGPGRTAHHPTQVTPSPVYKPLPGDADARR